MAKAPTELFSPDGCENKTSDISKPEKWTYIRLEMNPSYYVLRFESSSTRILSFLLGSQFRHLKIHQRELETRITSFRWLPVTSAHVGNRARRKPRRTKPRTAGSAPVGNREKPEARTYKTAHSRERARLKPRTTRCAHVRSRAVPEARYFESMRSRICVIRRPCRT